MDSQDVLNIEVWEKRVIGPEVCLGRLALMKASLPFGSPRVDGFRSSAVTLPLQDPKDRKSKHVSEANLVRTNHSAPVAATLKETSSLLLHPSNSDILESSSEQYHSRGNITFRINYESRHQEWMELAPLRGQCFVWGAVRSQSPEKLALVPQIVPGLPELLQGHGIVDMAMMNGFFMVLRDDGKYIAFGMNYAKIAEGDNACYAEPHIGKSEIVDDKVIGTAAGMTHLLLVTEEGRLYSLGTNDRGELGRGFSSDIPDFHPHRVTGLGHEFVIGASAGQLNSLAWTRDGKLFSWGDASLVRMWTPETDWIDGPFDHLAHTDEDEADRENRDIAPTPKRVQGLEGVHIVKAQTNLTISAAISNNGDLYTWGDHHCAGYDTKNLNVQYPHKIEALAGRVQDVAVGSSFVVALDVAGQLWTWGCMFQKNQNPVAAYPLGRGGERSFQPTKLLDLPKMRHITCTGTTLFAVDTEGQLWCWGDSPHGECFRPGVSYGRPFKTDYFQELNVELVSKGYGSSFCVYTSPQ